MRHHRQLLGSDAEVRVGEQVLVIHFPSAELQGYEVSVLFLLFVAITLTWEAVLGVLTFVNNLLRGKRANWLNRVKEEVLALGVVSLVLLFMQPVLEHVCKPSEATEDTEELDLSGIPGAYYVCPPGMRNVFPAAVIHAAHYLLFYLAVVHILFNMTTNSITMRKFAWMVALEREARNQDVALEAQQVAAIMEGGDGEGDGDGESEGASGCSDPLLAETDDGSSSTTRSDDSGRSVWDGLHRMTCKMRKLYWTLMDGVDQRSFSLMRKVCMQRFEAHSMDNAVHSFSYVNIASQVLEADLEQVYAHAWLMILFMTFLLLYPKLLYQVLWANAICLVILLVMAWKLQSVMKEATRICRLVLIKGVEHQKHMRKEDRLLQLSTIGEDKKAHPDTVAAEVPTVVPQPGNPAVARAPSFMPFKRASSGRNGSMGRAPKHQDSGDEPSDMPAPNLDMKMPDEPEEPVVNGAAASPDQLLQLARNVAATSDSPGMSEVIRLLTLQKELLMLRQMRAARLAGKQHEAAAQQEQQRQFLMSASAQQRQQELQVAGRVAAGWDDTPLAPAHVLPTQLLSHVAAPAAPALTPRQPDTPAPASLAPPPAAALRNTGQTPQQPPAARHAAAPSPPSMQWVPAQDLIGQRAGAGPGEWAIGTSVDEALQRAQRGQASTAHTRHADGRMYGRPPMPPAPPMAPAPSPPPPGMIAPGVSGNATWQPRYENSILYSMGSAPASGPGIASGNSNPWGGSGSPEAFRAPQGGPGAGLNGHMPWTLNGGSSSAVAWQPYGTGGIPSVLSVPLAQTHSTPARSISPDGLSGFPASAARSAVATPQPGTPSAQPGLGMWQVNDHGTTTAAFDLPAHPPTPPAASVPVTKGVTWQGLAPTPVPGMGIRSDAELSNGPLPTSLANGEGGVLDVGCTLKQRQPRVATGPKMAPDMVRARTLAARQNADFIVDAKHARERSKSKKQKAQVAVQNMHLPYRTLAELAEEVEAHVKKLFWFHHPHLMLWLVNIIFLVTSLSTTTAVAFVIPYAKFQKLATLGHSNHVWLPVLAVDVLMAVYLSWSVLPTYALITTAGTSFPPRVIEEVRAAKTLSHEEHHGISGMLLMALNHVFVGVKEEKRGEGLDLATYFISSLADHAGIVLSPHLRSLASKGASTVMAHPDVRNVLREFAQFWHDVAWYGPPTEDYQLTSDLSHWKDAFGQLDSDGSGALSFGELAQMVRSLGALATAGDIETMLWEVDLDGSRSVGFDEFMKFLAYAYFDVNANGYIGLDEIDESMKRLGLRHVTPESCSVLMSAADHNQDGRIGMREFFMLFEKLQVEKDDGSEEGGSSASGTS